MKILAVNWQDLDNPQAGGAEVHLFEILARLADRGHGVRLVCSGFAGGAPTARMRGVEVTRVGDRQRFTWMAAAAIRAAAATWNPDVVIDDVNKLPLATPWLVRQPVYAIVPHLFGTTAFHEVSPPLAAVVWGSERLIPLAYRRAWFHAISESTRDDLVARGIPPGRIVVVHPGVDTMQFTPDPSGRRAEPPRFVYLGRLKRYKGVETLIEAAARARYHSDITVDIAGRGADRHRLERLVARRGLGEAVRFHGYVDDALRLRLLRQAVANVFPSPKEGWGITVMEAAACGTPSIASNSPGLRDSVRQGATGLLVPHGDPAALAHAMTQLASDAAGVESLGRRARQWALQHTWEAVVDVVEQHLVALGEGRPLTADSTRSGGSPAVS